APDDPAGWQRLVRSYAVLGRAEAAQDALARGVAALGADTPEGAALREAAAAQGIGAAGAAATTAPADAPGPARAEIEAAGAMSDEDRAAMVEGMVARLDARLREAPDDPAGWQRLVRSYAVLGRAEAA
ncbi:c-type cytochrome biogenesis protein CcmI, partial [Aquibium sp. A9E412]|nr:c-type cytochrome biogenesis protein CcmI [Aquibium sp. A9E412]